MEEEKSPHMTDIEKFAAAFGKILAYWTEERGLSFRAAPQGALEYELAEAALSATAVPAQPPTTAVPAQPHTAYPWQTLPPARTVRLTPIDADGLPTGEAPVVFEGRFCVEVWSGEPELDSYFRHGGPTPRSKDTH